MRLRDFVDMAFPRSRRSDRLSAEELTAMEISEDKRLREVGIDPNGDPVDIMKQVRSRHEKLTGKRRAKKKSPPPKA
jgi:hypothetical protein